MRSTGYTAVVDGRRVDILHNGTLVATGAWTGQRIEDCPALFRSDPDSSVDDVLDQSGAIFAELEERLIEEEAAALVEPVCNVEGVDLTLIDWCLSMTPRERLRMVEAEARVPFGRILEVLEDHGVEYIIIGGVAACLQGADYNTKDLDILYSRGSENIRRLSAALAELEALFRDFAGRRIAPNPSHLLTHGTKLLQTKFGPLDLLGTLSMEDDGTTYETLVEHAVALETPSLTLRVLSLERLIEAKQRAGRPKDIAVLPILRAALERSVRRR